MNTAKKFVAMMLVLVTMLGAALPVSAATTTSGCSMPSTITVAAGSSKKITLTECKGYYCDIWWGSDNPKCADLGDSGGGSFWGEKSWLNVKGVKAGTTQVMAYVHLYRKANDESTYVRTERLYCKVVVTGKSSTASTSVALSKISLNKSSASLKKGGTTQLSVSYSPTNTTASKSVTWTTSNSSVATVSNGKVTAKAPGSATITAKCGTKTATCRVTVTAPLTGISLNKSSVSLTVGDKTTLSVSYSPSNTTDSKKITWTSTNATIANISSKGEVVANKAGTATITAKCNGKTATCKVTVKVKATSSSSTASSSTGTYKSVSDAYTYLNQFRTTKSNQWYWNSSNSAKVTVSGLGSLKRDATLENIAKKRAKEQWTQYYVNGKATHDRPNGTKCWTAYTSGSNPCGENLAWGVKTSKDVINTNWAETTKKYSGQGHRRNMLSKQAIRVGIACYEQNGKTCWAMCLGY